MPNLDFQIDSDPATKPGFDFQAEAPIDFQSEEHTNSAVGDFLRRVPASAAEGALSAVAGIERMSSDGGIGQMLMTAINPTNLLTPDSLKKSLGEFASDAAARTAGEYGVDPTRDQSVSSKVAGALGGIWDAVPLIAAGGIPALAGFSAQMLGGAKEGDYQRLIGEGKPEEQAQRESTNSALIKTGVKMPLFLATGTAAGKIADSIGLASPLQRAAVRFAANLAGNTAASATARGVEAAIDNKPVLPAVGDFSVASLTSDLAFALHPTAEGYRVDSQVLKAARAIVDGTSEAPAYTAHLEAAKQTADPDERANIADSLRLLVGSAHDVLEHFKQPDANPEEAAWYRGVQNQHDNAVNSRGAAISAEDAGLTESAAELHAQADALQQQAVRAARIRPEATVPADQAMGLNPEASVHDRGTPYGDAFEGVQKKAFEEPPVTPTPVEKVEPTQKAEEPQPVSADQMVPALQIGNDLVKGQPGDNHRAIYDRYIKEHGADDQKFEAATLALADDEAHVFAAGDQVLDRKQAASALGETKPLHSERLREIQKSSSEVSKATPALRFSGDNSGLEKALSQSYPGFPTVQIRGGEVQALNPVSSTSEHGVLLASGDFVDPSLIEEIRDGKGDLAWKREAAKPSPEAKPSHAETEVLAQPTTQTKPELEKARAEVQPEPAQPPAQSSRANAPTGEVAATPKSASEILHGADRVNVKAPEGATVLRVTPEKGAPVVETIKNVDSGGRLTGKKGMNVLRDVGPFKKVEAGTMGGKGGKEFIPIAGDVEVQDARAIPGDIHAIRFHSFTPKQQQAVRVEKGSRHLEDVFRIVDVLKRSVQGVKIRVLRNESELPQSVRDVIDPNVKHEGLTDVKNGDVWIFSDHLAKPSRAAEVFAHEVIGHYGVERVIEPGQWKSIADTIFSKHQKEATNIARLYVDGLAGKSVSEAAELMKGLTDKERSLIAKEFVARLAENPQIAPTLWRRIVTAVQSALRKLGIRRQWSEGEIRDLIRRGSEAVQRPPTGDGGIFGSRSAGENPDRLSLQNEKKPTSKSQLEKIIKSIGGSVDDDGYGIHLDAPDGYVWLANGQTAFTIHYSTNRQSWFGKAISEEWNSIKDGVEKVTDQKQIEQIRYDLGDDSWGSSLRASRAEPEFTTSTKNELTEYERAVRGVEEIERQARQSNEETFGRAEEKLKSDPRAADRLIDGLNRGDIKSVSEIDEALMLGEKVRLMKERNRAGAVIADPSASDGAKVDARNDWYAAEQRLNDVDQATYASGRIWGRLGQFRQRLMSEDYSFDAMERRARVELDRPLSPEETAKIKEQADRIAELEKRLADFENRKDQTDSTKAADDKVSELKKKGKGKPISPKDIAAKIKKRLAEKDTELNDIRAYVQRLALHFVRSGVSEREPLVDAVHQVLKTAVPDIERRQTQDLISGYGDFKPLDPEVAKATLRDLKSQLQNTGKLADIEALKPLQKTGIERQTPSDATRRMIKLVNEAKKKFGVITTDPASQLKSSLEAIKTRLRNQIKDLATQIDTGERPPDKTQVQYDEQAEKLEALRDRLKQTLEEIEGKPEMTDEQRIEVAKRSITSQIDEYTRRIDESDTSSRKGKAAVSTPELEALRARRDALREEYKEMELLDADLQDARNAKRDASQIEQTQKSITELDRRIADGDLDVRTKPDRKISAELERLRAERSNKGKLLVKLRRDALPKRTPEQIALQSLKSRMLHERADLMKKLARKDFERPPKNKPVTLDPEGLAIRADLELTKKRFAEGVFEKKLADRSVGKRVIDHAAQTLNLTRAVLTSFDLSGVLRQGGFISLGNPARAARALPGMFRAFGSEVKAEREMQALKARPQWDAYKEAKLEITDNAADHLTHMEEQYMSRWVAKIPRALGGGFVRGSERAYRVFLNRLRADTFDSMTTALAKTGTPTAEESQAIANFINVATGRGALEGKYRNAAAAMNTVFFAPRYVLSRFQLLAGQPLIRGSARTRQAVAGEYAKFLGGAAIVYGLASLAQDEKDAPIELDPRSSDFLKVRFGDTRLDPLAGLIQTTTLLSRLATGETKKGGQLVPIRGENVPYGGANSYDVMARFLRTKLAPLPGGVVNEIVGKDISGQPMTYWNHIPVGTLKNLVVPISFEDAAKAFQYQGIPKATGLTILSLFGFGLQSYAAGRTDEEKQRQQIIGRMQKRGITPTPAQVEYELKASAYRKAVRKERADR